MSAIQPLLNPDLPTLNKFGVPVLPNGFGSGAGLLMPKLKHRFQITFTNFGYNPLNSQVLTQQVVSCGRPTLNFNNTPIHSYNNIMYIAQKPEWGEIELVLRDDISNKVTSLVSAQVQKQMNHYTQSAAPAGINYKFEMYVNTLDGTSNTGTGALLEQWYLEGCFIQQVAYDSLEYSSSDAVQITLTIKFDNATQGSETIYSALGTPNAGNPGISATTPTSS
jgi:hypothetical protein